MNRFKRFFYELYYGHPFLLKEEADIICETRFDPKFSYLNEFEIKKLVKIRVREMYKRYNKQLKCNHEKWDCDNQIRVIECKECGKRAWIDEYKNIYNK